jgi:hypothetical protein
MKKAHLGLIVSVIILFSYQNCQKIPNEITAIENNSEVNPTQAIILAEENIQKITFLFKENTTVQQSAKTYTLVSQNSYEVNYKNGEIIKSSEANSTTTKYCLGQSDLSELKSILESASVCKVENSLPADTVCTMAYQFGYAQIITDRNIIDLGSGSDGCGRNKIDLCSVDSADLLKGWFQTVKNQLPNFICQ